MMSLTMRPSGGINRCADCRRLQPIADRGEEIHFDAAPISFGLQAIRARPDRLVVSQNFAAD
ncbi:hypothetical protein [Pantanalinema sp. GBBB05]|uniref:hypothetical protein n=1 Tax=Pantanalinema sp. GBBB05 TaxID=2604139 RepID=UPI001D1BBD20|nr:hypothetical protein [Pantanalinema sp. GBBB05]